MNQIEEAIDLIQASKSLVFLTGAGVSVPSGIPDYRSLDGVYAGLEQPEYLLSQTCLKREPEKFYHFIKHLYHPTAQPNIIHQVMAELTQSHNAWIISQNIDGLHQKASAKHLINFHGSLSHVYCQVCGQEVSVEQYLYTNRHEGCGGYLRPDIVLYEEGLDETMIQQTARLISEAETIVVVGTSLRVYPFASLLNYRSPHARVILINQEESYTSTDTLAIIGEASEFFLKLQQRRNSEERK